jgi:aryl-alcohol dehydrogenase-like predicted oxidoreductase
MQLEPDTTSTDEAIALLRRAADLGVDHVGTASFYSDGEVNRRIRAALSPYADDLVIVSKVGARSVTGGNSGWTGCRWSPCGAWIWAPA